MAFHVSDKKYALFGEVVDSFQSLLKKRLISGIDGALDHRMTNFSPDGQPYFAVLALNYFIFRSRLIIARPFYHRLHCLLQVFLRKHKLFLNAEIDGCLLNLRRQMRIGERLVYH